MIRSFITRVFGAVASLLVSLSLIGALALVAAPSSANANTTQKLYSDIGLHGKTRPADKSGHIQIGTTIVNGKVKVVLNLKRAGMTRQLPAGIHNTGQSQCFRATVAGFKGGFSYLNGSRVMVCYNKDKPERFVSLDDPRNGTYSRRF